MARERRRTYTPGDSANFLRDDPGLDLEAMSDEELEALLFEEEPEKSGTSAFNLPTVAGLSLIVIGMVYIFQHLGMWSGIDVTQWVGFLPWLAGILIILTGLGVLSWRPRKRATVKRRKVHRERMAGRERVVEEAEIRVKGKRRLTKSDDKKVAGVCSGIADYFNIDPTLVRIAFVVGTLVTNGAFLLAYVVLSFVMPKDDDAGEERITIIRD